MGIKNARVGGGAAQELNVDGLLTGGVTVQEVQYRKEHTIEIFHDACFTLHKWHSKVLTIENKKTQTYRLPSSSSRSQGNLKVNRKEESSASSSK